MGKWRRCNFRYLLLLPLVLFIYVQMRLFVSQSVYADRLATAVEAENNCTSQILLLLDQIRMQQGTIAALEEERMLADQEITLLRSLVQDLKRMRCREDDSEAVQLNYLNGSTGVI